MYSDSSNGSIMFMNLVAFIPAGYYLITKLTSEIVGAVTVKISNHFLENVVLITIGLIVIYYAILSGSLIMARSLPYTLQLNMPESSAVFSRWQERTKRSAVNVVVVDQESGEEIKLNLLNITEEMGLLHGGEPMVYASLKDQKNVAGYLLDYQDLSTGRWIHLGYPYTADQVACSYQEIMVMTLALNVLFLLWQHLRLRADLGHFPLSMWWPTLAVALLQGAATAGGHPVGMEVSGRHGSRPPFDGDGAFRHAAAAGLLAAGGLPADSPDRRGCPPARDFRRREEGHLAKDGIFGYSPGYPGSRKRQGGKILP